MLNRTLVDYLPLWALYLATIAAIMLAVEAGMRLGQRWHRIRQREGGTAGLDAVAGILVAAVLGLVAFLLGFTFSIATSWFGERRLLVVREANAIGTSYLRTQMLPEPVGDESRQLFRDYVRVRVDALRNPTPEKVRKAIADSEIILDKLWSKALTLTQTGHASPIDALYVASLNEVIDVHGERLAAVAMRVPDVIWLAIYIVIALATGALGFCFGVVGKGGVGLNVLLAVAFATVILLVADLDRSAEGLLRVSQQPLIEVQQKLNQPALREPQGGLPSALRLRLEESSSKPAAQTRNALPELLHEGEE